MSVELWSLLSVLGVSLVSLLGLLTISMRQNRLRQLTTAFVGFAVGALLGDAFIHLIPDAFARGEAPLKPSLLILLGMMLFFVVEKLLRHQHGMLHRHYHGPVTYRPEVAAINVIGDAIHNCIDGMLIAASYLASPALGISTTAAVLLHEIPQEFGDFSILIHSGLSARKALLLNLASASAAIAGNVLVLTAGIVADEVLVSFLLPVTAGGFVYLAAADLIPDLQEDRSLRGLAAQAAMMALGIGLMVALTFLE